MSWPSSTLGKPVEDGSMTLPTDGRSATDPTQAESGVPYQQENFHTKGRARPEGQKSKFIITLTKLI